MIEFFDYVFEDATGGSSLATTNQVWWIKEIFQGLYLAGMFLFVLSEGALLLRTKFFATGVHTDHNITALVILCGNNQVSPPAAEPTPVVNHLADSVAIQS